MSGLAFERNDIKASISPRCFFVSSLFTLPAPSGHISVPWQMPEDRSRSAAVDGGELVIHRSSYQEALEIGDNVRFDLILAFTGIFTDHVVDNLPECKPQSKQSVRSRHSSVCCGCAGCKLL